MDKNLTLSTPIVSVIMPAYNAEDYIQCAIDSVIAQSYSNWELIIVDDGSTDKTAAIIAHNIEQDVRIKSFYQQNGKQGKARNLGISHAKGFYIAFLDSDDLWMPNKLKCQIQIFENKNIDIVYTSGYKLYANKNLEEYPSIFGMFDSIVMYEILFKENIIPILSVLIKADFVRKVGYLDIDINLQGCEDWNYWIRCALSEGVFYGINEKHFIYRHHDNGMSRNISLMRIAEINVLIKNYYNLDYKNRLLDKIKIKLFEDLSSLIYYNRQYVIDIITEMIKIKFSISYIIILVFLRFRLNILNNYFKFLFILSNAEKFKLFFRKFK